MRGSDLATSILVMMPWLVPGVGCTSSSDIHDCPGTTTTEAAIVQVTSVDGGDGGLFQTEAGPGPDCVAACKDQVIACSSVHRCAWKTWYCVTCTYQNRCE